MRRIIYKYELEIGDEQVRRIPRNSRLLSIANQQEKLCVWAEIDADARAVPPYDNYKFFIRGTGHVFEDNALLQPTFLGTVLMAGGSLVWHVYYQKED
jgi:hypothetical protein